MKRFLRIGPGAALVTTLLLVVLFAMSADARMFRLWGGTPVRVDITQDYLYPYDSFNVYVHHSTRTFTPGILGLQYAAEPIPGYPYENPPGATLWNEALLNPPLQLYCNEDPAKFVIKRTSKTYPHPFLVRITATDGEGTIFPLATDTVVIKGRLP